MIKNHIEGDNNLVCLSHISMPVRSRNIFLKYLDFNFKGFYICNNAYSSFYQITDSKFTLDHLYIIFADLFNRMMIEELTHANFYLYMSYDDYYRIEEYTEDYLFSSSGGRVYKSLVKIQGTLFSITDMTFVDMLKRKMKVESND